MDRGLALLAPRPLSVRVRPTRWTKIARRKTTRMKRASVRARPTQRHIGALSPRYSFALNPYTELRFTICPGCGSTTRVRRLALAIHVDQFGMVILRKMCRLCTGCDMVIAHQDELAPLISGRRRRLGRSIVRRGYLVLGTVDLQVR